MRPILTCVVIACSALLLVVFPQTARAQVEQLDNLVVVVDASGSMKDEMGAGGARVRKMDAAKQALKQVLATIPDATNVGVLVLPRDEWVYDLGPRDTDRLFAAIDSIQPGGKTPLGRFIKLGADRLLEQRRRQLGLGSYRLLIITDGEAGDPELVDRFTPDVMSRGIRVDAIGVDMATDHTLATRVHSYRRADDEAALFKAIRDVVAEVTAGDLSDTADGDAFELIAGLPDGMAQEIITALASSGNHPIGRRPQQSTGQPEASSAGSAPQPRNDGGSSGGGCFFASATIGVVVPLGLVVPWLVVGCRTRWSGRATPAESLTRRSGERWSAADDEH